jgi:hypothetical protein
VRVPDPVWDAISAAAETAGIDNSKLVNQILAWWTGQPGAKLPERPGKK